MEGITHQCWKVVIRGSRSIITHAAPHHGADVSCAAEQLYRDSNRLGHCERVALRGDQEPALVIFREVAARRDPLRTILELSG